MGLLKMPRARERGAPGCPVPMVYYVIAFGRLDTIDRHRGRVSRWCCQQPESFTTQADIVAGHQESPPNVTKSHVFEMSVVCRTAFLSAARRVARTGVQRKIGEPTVLVSNRLIDGILPIT